MGSKVFGGLGVLLLAVVLVVLVAETSAAQAPASPTQVPGSPPNAPPPKYVLGTGDVIDVIVVGHTDLTQTYTVGPDGSISAPLIGRVPAAGRTVDELTADLVRLYKQYLRNPSITVRLKEFRAARIAVMGQVKAPGTFPYKEGDRVLDAVVMAGGQAERGDLGRVVVLRNKGNPQNPQVIKLDLRKAMQGDMNQNPILQDRDIVYVAEVGTTDPAKILPWAQIALTLFRIFFGGF
jgi:polysaccharide export outer membrane protein